MNLAGGGITDAATLNSRSRGEPLTPRNSRGLAAKRYPPAASTNVIIVHPMRAFIGGVDHSFTGRSSAWTRRCLQTLRAQDVVTRHSRARL